MIFWVYLTEFNARCDTSPYPLQNEELIAEIEKLELDPKWKIIFEGDGVYLFKKN